MLTMHKIPLRANPILYLKDRLRGVNHRRTAAIVPTNRNLRRLASCARWEIDIQTVSEFTQRANLYTNVLLPKELRKYYLYKAAKSLSEAEQSAMLHSSEPNALKSYIHFIQSSSELLPFYRELNAEGIGADKLKAESLYHDYQEQVEILTGLWQIYIKNLRSAGFADEWEYYANPSLDADYLSRYDNYFFLIGGYLNNYEITQLKSIAENRRVELYFNCTEETHYQKEKLEKAFGVKMTDTENNRPLKWHAIESDIDITACTENSALALVYHNQEKIRTALRYHPGAAVTEIRPCATVIEQFELITRRINELHFIDGVPPGKIAVVLPSPELAPLFLSSDPYSLYNVSAGRPVSSYTFHETLVSLREMLAGESKGRIPLELLEQFLASPYFLKRGVKTFLDRIYEMRESGAVYMDTKTVHSFGWAGAGLLRAMVIPFTAQCMTYDECLQTVAKILETIKHEAAEEETEGILKTIDETEKMRLLYHRIKEEFPPAELLRIVLDELAPLSLAVNKGEVSVLGLLESRNMQYDYLFIPGMNSGNFPSRHGKDLFLNSELRGKLELPTAAAREALQKGYCHQIIARAKHTVITYSSGEENQPSSFINELLNSAGALVKEQTDCNQPYEAANSVLFPSIPYKSNSGSGDEIIKDNNVAEQIKSFTFSATSLNCYRNCPLQFFYRYIKKLRERAGAVDDIDMRVVGTVMHSVMETLFREGVSASDKSYLERMNSIFDEKIIGYDYFTTNPIGIFHAKGIKNSFPVLAGHEKARLENGAVIQEYEGEVRCEMFGFRFKGQIDRWDRTPEGYDIIDYKYKKLEELRRNRDFGIADDGAFDSGSFDDIDLQLPLYALMMEKRHGVYPEKMLWFDLKGDRGFISGFYKESLDGFKIYTEKLMTDAAEPGVPFRNARKADTCKYCEYKIFCRRCLT